MADDAQQPPRWGKLAAEAGQRLQVQICESYAGYYLGTLTPEGTPYTRESQEYWTKREEAARALTRGQWTQKRLL